MKRVNFLLYAVWLLALLPIAIGAASDKAEKQERFTKTTEILKERARGETDGILWYVRMNSSSDHGLVDEFARAISNRCTYLLESGVTSSIGIGTVIACYDELDRLFGNQHFPVGRALVVEGLTSKSLLLNSGGVWSYEGRVYKSASSEEAFTVFGEIERRFGKDDYPVVRVQIVRSLILKAQVLENDIAIYDDIARQFEHDKFPDVRAQAASALLAKVRALGETETPNVIIAVYDEIDQRFGKDESLEVRGIISEVLEKKGHLLQELNEYEAAVAVYDEIKRRFGSERSYFMVNSLFNKGEILRKQGKFADAIAVYDEIERDFRDETDSVIQGLVHKTVSARATVKAQLSRQ